MAKQVKALELKLTPEEEAAAERIYAAIKEKVEQQVRNMTRMMAAKKASELLGRTEFELRDMVLQLGANVLEAAVNERVKKGA
ncbi:MAG: hypothetical protein ACRD3W_16985 [Terriglobales bacterium]